MCSCWDLQPKERPTAQTILRKIIRVRQEGTYRCRKCSGKIRVPLKICLEFYFQLFVLSLVIPYKLLPDYNGEHGTPSAEFHCFYIQHFYLNFHLVFLPACCSPCLFILLPLDGYTFLLLLCLINNIH